MRDTGDSPVIKEGPEIRVGETSETKHLEKRYDDGKYKTKDVTHEQAEPKDPHAVSALVSTQNFDQENKPTDKTLRINSPHLLRALNRKIKYYPSHKLGFEEPVEISSPFALLFHYEHELSEYKSAIDDEAAKKHLTLLSNYLADQDGAAGTELINAGLITFRLLWSLFKPGDLMYTRERGHDRLYWLESTAYGDRPTAGKYLQLDCSYTAFDEKRLGRARQKLRIYESVECPGSNPVLIESLSVSPLKCYKGSAEQIKNRLSLRGKEYEKRKGRRLWEYKGMCMRLKTPPGSYYYDDEDSFSGVWLPHTISGRVELDYETFVEDHAKHKIEVRDWTNFQSNTTYGPEDKLALCPPYVFGHSLSMRCWCKFYINQLTAVDWRKNSFRDLLLPDEQKKVIRSLVSSHLFPTETIDEAKLKGKVLVVVLHGTPGTGKTLTAEAVAEETKTPLLLYPAGELGSRLSEIESEIKRLVRYATVWKAVLLIDEADVFLESRQSAGQTSLERNALVAVFLRQLEYFQGIIFLTSNRAQNFDAAIKSRIHLTIQYTAPDATLRRKLWRQKLEPLLNQGQCILDTNKTIEVVSKYEMNGREISNTVNSARTVAADSGDVLKLEHLEVVLKVWKESQTVVDKDKSFLKKPSPWMLRLMAAVMFGAALRLSFLGFKRLRNRGILRRSR